MPGQVRCITEGPLARVEISYPGKLNAMSRAMWRELCVTFERLHEDAIVRCVIVQGEAGAFCAGGDISEYPAFRFDEAQLADCHEKDVWGGLRAMLQCDKPVVAAIEGPCMGAGMEIASCCDIRIAGESSKFGAPIAKLGFPMAPREAMLVGQAAGGATAREMLLEAAVLGAAEMKSRGFLNRMVADEAVPDEARACAEKIASLSPQAARLNKQALRALGPTIAALDVAGAYKYAESPQHREGIMAFLEKRRPVF
jgi:enoyl-CoA hydratase/carnithine racemase